MCIIHAGADGHWKSRKKKKDPPAGFTNRKCYTLCTFAVGSEQKLRPPRQGVPTHLLKSSHLAALRKGRVRTRVCSGGGFFPLGSRSVETVKETADGEKTRR
jgi:hypothetical protein